MPKLKDRIFRSKSGVEARFYYRPDTQDESIIQSIFVKEAYTQFCDIKAGDVVVDIGGHIGTFSIYAGLKGATVYSLEPIKQNFELLEKNIKANDLTGGRQGVVKAYNYAIGKEKGDLKLYYKVFERTGSIGIYNPKEKALVVKAVTFAKVRKKLKLEEIDFLKLDCEGGEYFIVNRENLSGVRALSMEWHFVDKLSKIIPDLIVKGFKITNLIGDKYRGVLEAQKR